MKYLVDSDYVADYLGARPHAIQLLFSFAKDDLSISLITSTLMNWYNSRIALVER